MLQKILLCLLLFSFLNNRDAICMNPLCQQDSVIGITIIYDDFVLLTQTMTEKLIRQDTLSLEECIVCVRIYNTLNINRRILRHFCEDKETIEIFMSLFNPCLMSFVTQLQCNLLDKYFYSKKYDIYIGGGTPGGANYHHNSQYYLLYF